MRITCPYCGERALEEFTYRGDATVSAARRASSRAPSEPGSTTSICATTRPGCIASIWHHSAGCHAWLRGDARHAHARDRQPSNSRGEGGLSMSAQRQPARVDRRPDRPVAAAVASASTARSSTGHPGDTLASALLANGVRLVGRSFKYHRPRGILTAGSEEPNALVELRAGARREPNTRATTIELYDGLEAASQNRWPSLDIRPAGGEPAVRAVLRRRLLLQDLHVAGGASGRSSTSR